MGPPCPGYMAHRSGAHPCAHSRPWHIHVPLAPYTRDMTSVAACRWWLLMDERRHLRNDQGGREDFNRYVMRAFITITSDAYEVHFRWTSLTSRSRKHQQHSLRTPRGSPSSEAMPPAAKTRRVGCIAAAAMDGRGSECAHGCAPERRRYARPAAAPSGAGHSRTSAVAVTGAPHISICGAIPAVVDPTRLIRSRLLQHVGGCRD